MYKTNNAPTYSQVCLAPHLDRVPALSEPGIQDDQYVATCMIKLFRSVEVPARHMHETVLKAPREEEG